MDVEAVIDETGSAVEHLPTFRMLACEGRLSHHSETMAVFQALVSIQVTTVTKRLATFWVLTHHRFHVAASPR